MNFIDRLSETSSINYPYRNRNFDISIFAIVPFLSFFIFFSFGPKEIENRTVFKNGERIDISLERSIYNGKRKERAE